MQMPFYLKTILYLDISSSQFYLQLVLEHSSRRTLSWEFTYINHAYLLAFEVGNQQMTCVLTTD